MGMIEGVSYAESRLCFCDSSLKNNYREYYVDLFFMNQILIWYVILCSIKRNPNPIITNIALGTYCRVEGYVIMLPVGNFPLFHIKKT